MDKILLVEDDQQLGPSLKKYLEREGLSVTLAENLKMANASLMQKQDLIVLDWMLPDGQGIDFLKQVKSSEKAQLPIILLTAKSDLIDKVLGLESGANDYVTKPFEPRELLARIRVRLRETKGAGKATIAPQEKLQMGEIVMDLIRHEVTFKGVLVELTKMEFELLKLFIESPGRAYSREEILNKVWGYEHFPTTRTVDTHILQIRQKFYDGLIETIRGIGYRLKQEIKG
jgi:DNA-binding response OmpR family regulator